MAGTAAAIPLTTIGGGINRLRTKGGADRNSLYDLLNGYVTQANTVKVRPGSIRNANLATNPDPHFASVPLLIQNGADALGNALSISPQTVLDAAGIFNVSPQTYSLPHAQAVGLGYAYGAPLDIFQAAAWTIEFYASVTYNAASIGAVQLLNYGAYSGLGGPAAYGLEISLQDNNNGTVTLSVNDGYAFLGSSDPVTATFTVTESSLHHIAITWDGTTGRVFFDGVDWGAGTYSTWTAANNLAHRPAASAYVPNIVIGSNPGVNGMIGNGAIGEIRITRGIARYVTTFTPPPAPTNAAPMPIPGNLFSATKGLMSYQGLLHVFSSQVVPVPAGYALHVLVSPNQASVNIPIKEIHFSAPYLGGFYVVAEFTNGDIYHYWIQSASGGGVGGNSNVWKANTDYVIGDVVVPETLNGLTYVASRKNAANPLWTPNTAETVGNKVEPNVANGFFYTVSSTEGTAPTTGAVEPTWPTTDGAAVVENSTVQVEQTALAVAANVKPPPITSPRYSGLYTPP